MTYISPFLQSQIVATQSAGGSVKRSLFAGGRRASSEFQGIGLVSGMILLAGIVTGRLGSLSKVAKNAKGGNWLTRLFKRGNKVAQEAVDTGADLTKKQIREAAKNRNTMGGTSKKVAENVKTATEATTEVAEEGTKQVAKKKGVRRFLPSWLGGSKASKASKAAKTGTEAAEGTTKAVTETVENTDKLAFKLESLYKKDKRLSARADKAHQALQSAKESGASASKIQKLQTRYDKAHNAWSEASVKYVDEVKAQNLDIKKVNEIFTNGKAKDVSSGFASGLEEAAEQTTKKSKQGMKKYLPSWLGGSKKAATEAAEGTIKAVTEVVEEGTEQVAKKSKKTLKSRVASFLIGADMTIQSKLGRFGVKGSKATSKGSKVATKTAQTSSKAVTETATEVVEEGTKQITQNVEKTVKPKRSLKNRVASWVAGVDMTLQSRFGRIGKKIKPSAVDPKVIGHTPASKVADDAVDFVDEAAKQTALNNARKAKLGDVKDVQKVIDSQHVTPQGVEKINKFYTSEQVALARKAARQNPNVMEVNRLSKLDKLDGYQSNMVKDRVTTVLKQAKSKQDIEVLKAMRKEVANTSFYDKETQNVLVQKLTKKIKRLNK